MDKQRARELRLAVIVVDGGLVRRADGRRVGKADANHIRMWQDLKRIGDRLLGTEEEYTEDDTVRIRESGVKAVVTKAEADTILTVQLLEDFGDSPKLVKGAMLEVRASEVERLS